MGYDIIPEELKQLKQWVCWTTDKLPKNPISGGNAMSNNPSTWSAFNTAVEAVDKHHFDGVGFMFANGYFGVDIDDMNECPEIADDFMTSLRSYTEISVSGNGLHIICKGTLPAGGRRKDYVEMYQTGRYFIMTGNCPSDPLPVIDCTEEIKPLHAKYLSAEQSPVRQFRKIPLSDMSDSDVIDKARSSASGGAFQMLYQGNWQGIYGSQSEADLAFCNHLAFWTQKNDAQMDRIFRSSGLMREKWDRRQSGTTYGSITTQKAIVGTTDVYDPMMGEQAVSVSAGKFKSKKKPRKDYPHNDTGNANRFADMFRHVLRYSYQNKSWLFWDGKKWSEDITGELKKLVDLTIDDMKRQAFEMEDEEEQSALLKWIQKTSASKFKAAMLIETQHLDKIPITLDELDVNKDLLNCQNGIVNLKNGELIPHDPEYMSTRISFAEYDPNSTKKPERWLQFLDEITDGNKPLQHYLQKAVGYSLSGSIREQCMFFCYGTGQNGKSTFLDIVSKICGTYSSHAQPESIMLSNKNGVLSDIARLKGARFVTTVEPNEGVKLNEGLIKQLTGGDKVTARFLYGKEFEFMPEFKLWLGANHKPVIKGTDLGIWRRIHLIPFTVQIPDSKVDKGLIHKLRLELSPILSWAVEGCLAWQREGLGVPDCVKSATDEYRHEMDTIGQFCDEYIQTEYGSKISASDLYDIYCHWVDENHEYKMSNTKFGKEIVKKFPEKVRTTDGYFYRNLKINDAGQRALKRSAYAGYGMFTDSRAK